MTRVDLRTSEWHDLITPVLPHASTDKDDPLLQVVRLEIEAREIIAVATDRTTLAAERLAAETSAGDGPVVVHLHRADAAASLRLFTHGKDDDPMLTVVADKVPVPAEAPPGVRAAGVQSLGLRIDSATGTRLVLHDRRDPGQDPLGGWRKVIAAAVGRDVAQAASALMLNAAYLGRWAAAARRGERLAVFTGADEQEAVLVLVESHFAGIWKPGAYLDSAAEMLAGSPWTAIGAGGRER